MGRKIPVLVLGCVVLVPPNDTADSVALPQYTHTLLLGAGVAQLVSARPSELEVPGSPR